MANVTRIKNNQITDATITYAKITPGTLTGALFNPDITLASNVTITGNLTLTGNTDSISATNTYVNDPLVVFNNGYTGSPSYDIGLLINRNLTATAPYGSVNAAWIWRESDKAFEGLMTTETGATTGSINDSGFANLKIGNVTAVTANISGALRAGNILFSPISGSSGYFTTTHTIDFSTGNAVISGGYISALTNASITTGAVTTLQATNFSTSNAAITGSNSYFGTGSGLIANVYAGLGYFTDLSASNLGGITNASITTLQATNFSSGNAAITGGQTYIGSGGTLVANAYVGTGYFTNLSASNIAGVTNGAVTTLVATNFSSGNAAITGAQTYIGTGAALVANAYVGTGYFTDLSASNIAGVTNGAFTTLQATNFSTGNAQITGGQITGATGAFTTLQATDFSSGNAVISGGYISALTNASITTGAVTTLQATNFSSGNAAITGAQTYIGSGGALVANAYVGTGYFTNLSASNISGVTNGAFTTLQATNFSTGNARITGGYADNFPIGANTAATGAFTTVSASGVTQVTNATASTLTNNGALVVTGGVGIGGDLNVGGKALITGNLAVTGNLTVTGQSVNIGSSSLSIQDPIINLHTNSDLSPLTFNDGADIGVKFHYYDGGDLAAFLGRANDTGELEWYDRGNDTANVFTGTSYGGIRSGRLILANARIVGGGLTANTGTMQVWGDGSVSGNLFVGAALSAGTASFSAINNTLIGNITPSAGAFTYLTATQGFQTSNAAITGTQSYIGSGSSLVANVYSSLGYFTDLSAGNLLITTLTVPTLNATNGNVTTLVATNFSSGNAAITGAQTYIGTGGTLVANAYVGTGYFTNLSASNIAGVTNGAFTTLQATNFSSGNAAITGAQTYIGSGGALVANAYVGTGYFTDLSASNIAGVTNGAFTTLVATNFSSGNAVITGGSVNGSPIGASSASTGAFTTLTTSGTAIASGNLVAAATTSSTNTTTGALVVKGGAGIAGDVKIGTSLEVNSGAYGNVTTTQYASVFGAGGGANPYSVMQVRSSDAVSGMGMQAYTGSATLYANAGFAVVANATVRDRDVYSGGTVSTIFAANGAIINTTGIASTSAATGAVIITGTGGLGVGGNTFHAGSTIMNSSKTAGYDTIVKGNTDETLIWARPSATYDQVLIGGSATTSTLNSGVKLHVNSTDSMIIPTGTAAQRPGAAGYTDVTGMLRFNTTSGTIEWYTGTQWGAATTQFTVITDEQFNGDGSTVDFTLSGSTTTASTIVSINGVMQIPTLAYSIVTGTTLRFTEAPASGDLIDVRRLTTTQTLTGINSTNGKMALSADNDGVYIYTGGAGATSVTTYWNTAGAQVNTVANVVVSSANVATTVLTMDTTTYRSAKIVVQATQGANYQVVESLVISNGTTATASTYGIVQTNGNLGVISATQSGTNTLVQFIATNTNTNVRVKTDYITI